MSVSRVSIWTALALAVAVSACSETTAEPHTEDTQLLAAVQDPAADGAGRPAPRMGPAWVLSVADELGLSGEQRSKIRVIAEELRAENTPLFAQLREQGGQGGIRPPLGAGGGGSNDPIMHAIRENTRTAMERVRAVLTDDQIRILQDLRRTRMEELAGSGGPTGPGHAGPPGPAGDPGERILALADVLELTDQQIAELTEIFAEARARNEPLLEELRSRYPTDGGTRPDPNDPLLVRIRQNLREAMEKARAVLTEEQRATLDALRKDRPGPRPPGPPGG